MKLKFYVLLTFIVSGFYFSSCEKSSSNQVDNFSIEDALSQRLINYGYKIDDRLIKTFKDKSGITSITYLLEPNLWYTTYSNGKNLSKVDFIVKMTTVNEASKFEFTTINNEKLGYYIVKGGSVVESAGYDTLENRGWWSEFKACVKEHMDLMTSGESGGTVLALGCLAFGPECAAAIATVCSVKAAF